MVQEESSQIGLIGLAVMGQNLVLNLCDHGYKVSVYNRTYNKTHEFMTRLKSSYPLLQGYEDLKSFACSLEQPRKIILMVKAGASIDETLEVLATYLEPGDVIIDGGNSYYRDTQRRQESLLKLGIHFVGSGISGGEEGARNGPSIMPSGSLHAKETVEHVLRSISAKDYDGGECCTWIGEGGSGHFVKMVHNGIEYGDMQLICEMYDLMHRGLNASVDQCQALFESWKTGVLDSYLIDITAEILKHRDNDGLPLIDKIVDEAGQKGTGRWTVSESLEQNAPLTLIAEAVFARQISAKKALREQVQTCYPLPQKKAGASLDQFEDLMVQALYAAKVISYAQGFSLMAQASQQYGWNINLAEVARIWSGGCIIRSHFLKDISSAYSQQLQPIDLLVASPFVSTMSHAIEALRQIVALAVQQAIPAATLSSALAYFDALRSSRLPANLLQAQRDYFGAHTYQRIDRPLEEYFHTDWAKTGGSISSTNYNA
jgi:6-phosphogluconate dehydrogenase